MGNFTVRPLMMFAALCMAVMLLAGSAAAAGRPKVAPSFVSPPVTMSFAQARVTLGATSELEFTIPGAANATVSGVGFRLVLPTGLNVASGTRPVCGGTLATTPGPSSPPSPYFSAPEIQLDAVTVMPGSICQFSVPVIAAEAGDYGVNALLNYLVDGWPGSAYMSSELTVPAVAAPAQGSAAFSPGTIFIGRESSWRLTITNPNPTTALTGLWFYATVFGPFVPERVTANSCGGSAGAVPYAGHLEGPFASLRGGSLAAGASCAITVAMQGEAPGSGSTHVLLGSAQGGRTYEFAAQASLSVLNTPPHVTIQLVPGRVALGGTTRLRVTIANPRLEPGDLGSTLTSLGFIDALPAGVKVSGPAGHRNACGGQLVAKPGSATVGLLKGRLELGARCEITVQLRTTKAGRFTDSTGPITSAEAPDASAVMARLTVTPRRS